MTLRSLICRTVFLFSLLLALMPRALSAAGNPPFNLPPQAELNKIRSAILVTSKGKILIELFPKVAPWHVANLKYLADKGFYKNIPFHLFMEHYIIQGGDPTNTGNGGPGYYLPPEFSQLEHKVGTVGMSRRPDEINPERLSNGSQFHILLSDAPHMNQKYTIIGRVADGMDVVERLRKGDVIKDLRVFVRRN